MNRIIKSVKKKTLSSIFTAWKRKNFRIKKIYVLLLTSCFLLTLSLFFNFVLYKKNQLLKSALPYLVPGEKINYFDLIGEDREKINESILKNKISLLFIYKLPCLACNKNSLLWRRIAKIAGKEINIFGIALIDFNELVEFAESSRLNYKLYAPENIDLFRKKMRVKLNTPQTILYYNKVQYVLPGTITGDAYTHILRKLKQIKKNMKKGKEI